MAAGNHFGAMKDEYERLVVDYVALAAIPGTKDNQTSQGFGFLKALS
jgi:hypothetical protein